VLDGPPWSRAILNVPGVLASFPVVLLTCDGVVLLGHKLTPQISTGPSQYEAASGACIGPYPPPQSL
jgi:hypothetical protein